MLVGVAVMPRLVAGLGVQRFGVLTLAWSLFGYFGLLDLGLGRALTVLASGKLSNGRDGEVGMLVRTALLLTAIMGLAGGGLLFAARHAAAAALVEPGPIREELVNSLTMLALLLPLSTTSAGLRGLLEAELRFASANLSASLGTLLMFLLPALALPWSNSLSTAIAALAIGRLVSWVLLVVGCRHMLRTAAAARASRPAVKELFGFGGWVTTTNTVGPAVVYGDRYILAGLGSLEAVAYYATPHEVASRVLAIPQAINRAFLPLFARAVGASAGRAYDVALRVTAASAVLPMVACITLSWPALDVWLGRDFAEHSTFVLRILALAFLFSSIVQAPFAFVQARGRPDLSAKLHLVEAAIYLPATWWVAGRFGLIGVAWCAVARSLFDLLGLLWTASRLVDAPANPRRDVAVVVLASALPLGGLATPMSLTGSLVTAAVGIPASILVCVFGLLTASDRQAARATVASVLQRWASRA
jgi:O-antigen/teichoic acid export membrane protein